MSRILRIAGAKMGPNQKADSRKAILDRMIALLEDAAGKGAKLVVFPELPFTTFFPRWLFESTQELDTYFERELPGPQTRPLSLAEWPQAAATMGPRPTSPRRAARRPRRLHPTIRRPRRLHPHPRFPIPMRDQHSHLQRLAQENPPTTEW